MDVLFFLVSFLATVVGGISGVGGGIIIKPVLDATGMMNVTAISFLSGCTVLAMSAVNYLINRNRKGVLDIRISTPLALGAVAGGFLGKLLFDLLKLLFQNENKLGAVQAGFLLLITVGTLAYSLLQKKITTQRIRNMMVCGIIGLLLGMISSFLGIGGGPINLTVLYFYFSMDTKKAAANSLYIIMFSQAASILQTVASGTVPNVSALVLGLMIAAGVAGGLVGNSINKKITASSIDKLFIGFMIFIIGINIFNVVKFLT